MKIKASNLAQSKLYGCARRAWQSCERYQSSFIALRACYTPAYIAHQLAVVAAAQKLPDFQARTAETEARRIELIHYMRHATAHWQQLKRYISTSFPADMQHIMYGAAGEQYYRAAALKSWVKLASLMQAGHLFITKHQAQLAANNNMPASFVADFAAITTELHQKLDVFRHGRQTDHRNTADKIAANNHVAAQLSILLADAKVVFRNDDVVRQFFTLNYLRHSVHHTVENTNNTQP